MLHNWLQQRWIHQPALTCRRSSRLIRVQNIYRTLIRWLPGQPNRSAGGSNSREHALDEPSPGIFQTLDSFFRPVVEAFVCRVSQQEVDLTATRHDRVGDTATSCTSQGFTSTFLKKKF